MPDPDSGPLHQQNARGRFADRASDYARFRPAYPPEAIDAILAGLPAPRSLVAADVGAGTGISARLLADRGVAVHAIEPNASMRAAAVPHDRVHWHDTSAEATGLRSQSVHFVLCAQAFHWFRADVALSEFHRILQPRGRLALLWNTRDDRDPFTQAYGQAIVRVATSAAAAERGFDGSVIHSRGHFTGVQMLTFASSQALDLHGLLGRAASASYVPKSGPDWDWLSQSLRDLHGTHADASGSVHLRYVTRLWLAIRAGHAD